MNSLKTLVGGELTSYTEMMEKARTLATDKMVRNAEQMGADAVVCVRYSSSEVMQGAAEVLGYISRMAVDNSRPQSENSAGQDSFSSLAFDFIFLY